LLLHRLDKALTDVGDLPSACFELLCRPFSPTYAQSSSARGVLWLLRTLPSPKVPDQSPIEITPEAGYLDLWQRAEYGYEVEDHLSLALQDEQQARSKPKPRRIAGATKAYYRRRRRRPTCRLPRENETPSARLKGDGPSLPSPFDLLERTLP
jgi:hypothetical protein